MLLTENEEIIYEKQDITRELITEIYTDYRKKGLSEKRKTEYYNDFFTMDIETSTIGRLTDEPIAFTYSIAVYIASKVFIFRYWRDYKEFIRKLNSVFGLDKHRRIVCYVHNLPYEFQFMRDYMVVDELFATKPRKVVKFYNNGIEYRCSYKLTNMGLDRFTKTIPNIKHGKLSGEDFDYKILRTPSTELKINELQYIYNDVAGLYEALDYTFNNDVYTIANMPMTSTGFVRDELRHSMQENDENRKIFENIKLDQYQYGLLREARRGGNTHCNPIYSDTVLPDLKSKDMSSAYPAVMVQCKFPMTKFMKIRDSRLADFEDLIGRYACILDLTFKNIEVKTLNTIPYIAKAHCIGFPKLKSTKEDKYSEQFRGDNGRVLKAETLSMIVTDIDYEIIKETYKWDEVICNECFISRYDYLPDELRDTILKQYYDKTTLKDKDEYLYMKQKNKFNANFGCMLTDICQDTVKYIPNSEEPFIYDRDITYQEQLDKYYNSYKSFLSYQHGVWVTAHCRRRLQDAINLLKNDMVYCDTDSVKYFNNSNEKIFNILNKKIKNDIVLCGKDCTVEYKGKKYTLGIWEDDGDYAFFKSMGAKKYCYMTYDNNFNITVAGLSKTKARDYLLSLAEIEDKDIFDIFEAGTIVPSGHSGRTTARYNDYTKPKIIKVKGEKIPVGSNMVIEDTTYMFTLTEDYENLITSIREGVIW